MEKKFRVLKFWTSKFLVTLKDFVLVRTPTTFWYEEDLPAIPDLSQSQLSKCCKRLKGRNLELSS